MYNNHSAKNDQHRYIRTDSVAPGIHSLRSRLYLLKTCHFSSSKTQIWRDLSGLMYLRSTQCFSFSLNAYIPLTNVKNECIPVGCVPPAAVAIQGGLPQCMLGYTTPPGCGPGDPPQMWAWRPPSGYLQCMLRYHLQCMLGYHPLWTEFLTHASENITLPQTSFAGGNNFRF